MASAQERKPPSPAGTAATQVGGKWTTPNKEGERSLEGGKWIEISYSRPILRGRTNIFGKGADYGKLVNGGAPVWRAGANNTTRIKTEVPLVLGGKTLPAGEYSLFVDLKESGWTLIVSKQAYQQNYDANEKLATYGAYNYDPKFDVLRAPMKMAVPQVSRRPVHDRFRGHHREGRQAGDGLGEDSRLRRVYGRFLASGGAGGPPLSSGPRTVSSSALGAATPAGIVAATTPLKVTGTSAVSLDCV